MRAAAEMRDWAKKNPFPINPTPNESAAWHLAAREFEFGPGYVLVETKDGSSGSLARRGAMDASGGILQSPGRGTRTPTE